MRKDYGPLVRTARRLIRRFGGPAVIEKGAPPSAGWNPGSAGPADTINVEAVNVGYSITNRNDSAVQAGDWVGIVEATGYDIQPNDRLVIGSRAWTVVDAQPLMPGTTKILTDIVARR